MPNGRISRNEISFWEARSCCRPLSPHREDISEARILSATCGISTRQAMIDWYSDSIQDEEYAEQCRKEIQEAKEKRRLKEELKNV